MSNYVPSLSSDEVFIGQDMTVFLTPTLETMETNIASKAASTHTHDGYAAEGHSHTEYAAVSHEHTGYAATDHIHSEYAEVNHSHTGYAVENHTHSEYASSGHTHAEYFPIAGGTINGDTNIAGVLKANGQQAFYYATSTSSQTIGTANATGGTTIACGANANTVINGANVKMKNSLPQASNTYTLGSTTFRWKEIYANNAVNVASDERLKRDISEVDEEALLKFVDGLNVVNYNYNDDPEDANSRIGLIAQAVQNVDPEIAKYFVSEDSDGMLSLKPADLVFPLIIAVQKLSARVAELESK